MKRFDKTLKKQLKQEVPKIPARTEMFFEETLNKIETKQIRRKPWFSACVMLVSVAAVIFLFLNFKTGFLDEEKNGIIESDVHHSLTVAESRKIVEEPQIEEIESIRVRMIDYRNPEIREFTDMILTQFKKDRKESQKNPVADCEVVANTEKWFTLQLIVQEEKGDIACYYYNVDKKSCKIVGLSDLFIHEFDYVNVFSEKIKEQIKEESKLQKEYGTDSGIEGYFCKIDKNQEFYFNQKGNLVIVLEKEDAALKEKGNLRFVIEKEVFEAALK
ncbi:MAG: DUF3298 domain-containing protein [Lachnospiraceae bacterium]|jgi:Cation/multidrug efflux pump|nr:DUF3298 domain-containing protein [Lachnospiraceae bacterium]